MYVDKNVASLADRRKDLARKLRNPKKGRFFTKEHDPVMVELNEVIEESGLTNSAIEARCGVTAQTVSKIRNYDTKRPQNKTVEFIAKACGYERRFVHTDTGQIRERTKKE